MDIGQRLKIAREAIGYTLKKASQESEIGESSISEFENSKREPKFSQLSRLAEVYRKTIDIFLSDEPIIEDTVLWRDNPDSTESRSAVTPPAVFIWFFWQEIKKDTKILSNFLQPDIWKDFITVPELTRNY